MKYKHWYGFMSTDTWVVFMNLMRILLTILIVILIVVMIRNIEEVKTIANPCTMCSEKTGAICRIEQNQVGMQGFDLTNISLNPEP